MKKIAVLLFIQFLLLGCENTDDGTTSNLPALTTEGKNTFGCKIDGVNFLPKQKVIGTPYYIPELRAVYVYDKYYFNGYHLSINAINFVLDKNIHIEMTATETPLEQGKTYPITLNQEGNINGYYEYYGKSVENGDGTGFTPYYKYYTNNEFDGELEIVKLDTENKIISGRFWFHCQEINTNEIVKITEGRFDIKYTDSF